MAQPTLIVNALNISFDDVSVVNGISFSLNKGKTLAIVGESGSGKSITALAIMGLLPATAIITGEILFQETQLVNATRNVFQSIRGNNIAMIFQEPMTSLNPVFTVGEQIEEAIKLHQNKVSRKTFRNRTLDAMEEVGLARDRFSAYPHEFSGGMRQRVMIAMALVCKPTILIADEPTTALDATTARQIMGLLFELKNSRGMGMLFISHHLRLVASIADDVCVMKQGVHVEHGAVEDVLHNPKHAYTKKLLSCIPTLQRQ